MIRRVNNPKYNTTYRPSHITVEDKKGGGMVAEAVLLERAVPAGALICVLDERGKSLSSRQLSQTLARLRDDGLSSAVFLIGGADGFEP